MHDDRKYRILLKCAVGSVWVSGISHANFIDGIKNGGLKYFNNERQPIINFQIQITK